MQDNNNYIVKESPVLIRMLATRHLAGIYGKYIIGFVIFFALFEWVPNILGLVFPASYIAALGGSLNYEALSMVPNIPFVYVIYLMLLGGALSLGKTLYVMTVLRNRQVGYSILLEGMPFYFKATVIYVLQMFMLACGLSLLIVPGIYLYYTYSQALYILADDPNLTPFDCLRQSRAHMRGNIFNMIKVDLMYLSLIIFGMIPTIVMTYAGYADASNIQGLLIFFICRFTVYAAVANLSMGRVTFYELLRSGGFKKFKFAGEKDFRESLR